LLEVASVQNQFNKSNAPCIVSEGTLFNKRDMMRALETIEGVTYLDMIDDQVISKGSGVLIKVFASKDNATLVVNGSLFINVFSFDYLHFNSGKKGKPVLDLIKESRILRLIPHEDAKSSAKLSASSVSRKDDLYDEEEPCASLLDDLMEDEEE
jgi:hypothetical protein